MPSAHNAPPFTLRLPTVLLCLAGLATLPPAVHAAETAGTAGQPAARSFDIAPGPLSEVLARYAASAGVGLSFDAASLRHIPSPGLKGSYGIQQGFDTLLAGSGLEAVSRGQGNYALRQRPSSAQTETTLAAVRVSASVEKGLQSEGSTEDGYRVRTVSSVGALGSMPILDTPFSISVIPKELIENIQAVSPDDIYKLNPSTRTVTAQSTGWSPLVSIRGFKTYDVAEDGLRRPYNHAAVLEDKERVETLNGLSGFLYGASPPAGMINYVYKRPTLETFNSLTVGNYGGSQYYAHGDFGGRIDEAGRMGYRLNLVKQDGNTAVDDQKIDRALISGAFDWQLTDELLLELNASYNHYKTQAPSAYWFYSPGINRTSVPDASKNWSQPWIHDEFENTRLNGRLTYRPADWITLRGAYTTSHIDRPVQDHTMNSMSSSTEYRQLRQRVGDTKSDFDAAQAFADFAFDTVGIGHKLTLGYYTYAAKDWSTPYAPHTGWQGPYPVDTPARVPEYSFPINTSKMYYAGKSSNENFVIGDLLQFSPDWSALVGINHSRIKGTNFDETGQRSQPDYDKSRNSPSVSVMFKPTPSMTTYITYIEGLEMGGIGPTDTTNQDKVMPPMVSRQKEIGIKAEVGSMLLSGALFDIEKAYEFVNADNTYTQDGRQHHKGMEFSATGKLTRHLTLIGGVTLLDPSIRGGDNGGKEPMNVAKRIAKVYSEYALPFVPGLTLTGGVYFTGRQWADDGNTSRLPSYTTVDLGMRYTTQAAGKPLTLRVFASNVADRNYWQNSYYVGPPRSVAFSAQIQF